MSEFIKEFGKDNFIIMLAIVGVIILVLVVIVIIEKRNSRKLIRNEIDNINKNNNIHNNVHNNVNNTRIVNETKVEPIDNHVNDDSSVELLDNSNEDKVYYASNDTTVEEAKEKLEEVTKRLIDDNPSALIDHTNFEVEQEEKSIISYEELVKASHDIDDKNDKLLEDEGEAAITLEELYKKHQEEQSIIDNIDAINEKVKVSNPVFEEEKKFKNSEVISPVFGIYTGKIKPKNALKEMDKQVGPKDLEDEIQRTEDFFFCGIIMAFGEE